MENNNRNNFDSNYNNIPQLEPIDLKEIFFKIINYWVYILVTVSIFLVIAFVINRYSTRLYKSEMTMLIEDENSASRSSAAMERMGYSNPRLNFFNEKLILESFSQVERTIKKLDFEVSYFAKGNIKSSEAYKPSNFNIEYDTLHPQIVGALFDVKLLENNNVFVELEINDNITPKIFNLKLQKQIDSIKFDFVSKEYIIGEWITGNSYRFKVNINNIDNTEGSNRIEGFDFMLNTDESLANRYYRYVKVAPSEEGSSGMNLSTIGTNGSKDIVLLNAFADTYIQYGLDLKNAISDNTIKFIDNQVSGIQDSLNYAEDLLQRFRSDNKVIDLCSKGSKLLDNMIEVENELSKERFKLEYYYSIKNYLDKGKSLSNVSIPSAIGIEDPLMNKMILDTPPVGLVADALQITHLSDVNLFLVRQNYTEEGVLEFVENKYENSTFKNVNIIFNDFTSNMGYGYGGYSYGSKNGYGYYELRIYKLINTIKSKFSLRKIT